MKNLLRGFVRQFGAGAIVLVMFTAVLGLAYPASVWVLSRATAHTAEGSVLHDSAGCPAGSSLIGVDPQPPAGVPDGYLHGRPSVDPSASGPSNLGTNSTRLRTTIVQRRAAIARREGLDPSRVPADAVTGSGSGLDPDISPAYAALQVPRLARVLRMDPRRVQEIIDRHTRGRQWGFLGEARVDVLGVNLALGHRVPDCAAQHGRTGAR
ncbi:potassium-transporting ATPase subunit C [Gordonia sp. (in: high G+C Gram-positive bacteria)]|uniref:potassium-transporting ATPase subunit C n=1 Tax=Gordonia sp. (in: high G+C Gram-positive bacteria) TaxID=84139 RepID=UPI0035270F20